MNMTKDIHVQSILLNELWVMTYNEEFLKDNRMALMYSKPAYSRLAFLRCRGFPESMSCGRSISVQFQ